MPRARGTNACRLLEVCRHVRVVLATGRTRRTLHAFSRAGLEERVKHSFHAACTFAVSVRRRRVISRPSIRSGRPSVLTRPESPRGVLKVMRLRRTPRLPAHGSCCYTSRDATRLGTTTTGQHAREVTCWLTDASSPATSPCPREPSTSGHRIRPRLAARPWVPG